MHAPAKAPHEYRAQETAVLFPTGGYLWPGMGADLDGTPHAALLARAEDALVGAGVAPGALRRLMAGEGQARRALLDGRWEWSGDFPLSMVAQTVVGVALAAEFARVHGAPRVVVGESMGEIAACCAAGALDLEDAVRHALEWSRALEAASASLGLRMAVVEDLDEGEVEEVGAPLEAQIVVSEAPHLFVVALPRTRLHALEAAVTARGGRTLVSNNHCAAHDPRLLARRDLWAAHDPRVRALALRPPMVTILSTLEPGRPLDSAAALRGARLDATSTRVRWDETLRQLPPLGVRNLLQLGPPSAAYPLKKLRGEEPHLARVRIDAVATLAAAAALPARR